jgi:hypothetical protein
VLTVRYGMPTAHRVYVCVPYGSHNKQRLFPRTSLTDWALYGRSDVFPMKYGNNSISVARSELR